MVAMVRMVQKEMLGLRVLMEQMVLKAIQDKKAWQVH